MKSFMEMEIPSLPKHEVSGWRVRWLKIGLKLAAKLCKKDKPALYLQALCYCAITLAKGEYRAIENAIIFSPHTAERLTESFKTLVSKMTNDEVLRNVDAVDPVSPTTVIEFIRTREGLDYSDFNENVLFHAACIYCCCAFVQFDPRSCSEQNAVINHHILKGTTRSWITYLESVIAIQLSRY